MIPEEHEQITGRSDADRCDREVAVRGFLLVSKDSARRPSLWGVEALVATKPTSAAIISRPCTSRGPARLVPPALGAKHVPDAGDGVDPEQPDNAGTDYGMRALLRIGVAVPL